MELHLLLFISLVVLTATPSASELGAGERLRLSQKSLNVSHGSIPNTQLLAGIPQSGHAVEAKPLFPKVKYKPIAALMHQDGGNTGSVDYTGPLGPNGNVSSLNETFPVLLWHSDGRLTGVQAVITDGVTLFDLVALDPETFHVEATWSPPLHNDTLSVQYMELKLDDDALLVTTSKGKVFVVHREDTGDKPKFTLTRSIDLVKESILDTSARLLNGMFDSKGNIWWTTGSILPTDSAAVVDAVVGFITPDGGIAHTVLKNQNVENGIAVSNDTVFVATGPAGTAAQHDAEGYMYAFSSLPPPPESYQPLVEVRWRSVYPAGSRLKPGGFARGSGATPTLLGNSFVALTDNADVQVSILVYPQQPSHVSSLTSPSILNDHVASVCSVPLFTPNASAVDIAGLAHIDEHGNSGVLFVNTFNGPPFTVGNGPGGVNGAWNNMSAQDSGITRVDVVPHPSNSSGPSSVSCTTRWTLPLRMKSVPVLSLGTGLVYGYTQDEDLAIKGRWVWYVVAIDWDSGKEVWRVRTGAGGLWNDDYLPAAMGSDGTFYQAVVGGIVMVKDRS